MSTGPFDLRTVELPPPDGLSSSFRQIEVDGRLDRDVLVVAFAGVYPPGSRGNRHGHYMKARTAFGLVAFDPSCIVLDLRELEYTWGNTLLGVFQVVHEITGEEGEAPIPVLAVTSEKCRAAFLSLVTPVGGDAPDWHFESLDEAIAAGRERAREWLDS